jgi:rhamnogalacturonyl hydrolase YesR
MNKILIHVLIISVAASLSGCVYSDLRNNSSSFFNSWEKGTSPEEIGKKTAERFLITPHGGWGRSKPVKSIPYPETCTWYGALTFGKISGDNELVGKLVKRFEPLLTPDSSSLIPPAKHVDYCVFGSVPLEIYIQTKDSRYLDLGKSIADKQWENPTKEGLTPQTRFWIDDMYMITSVQVQAYRATGDEKYLNRAALEMATYLDTLQQQNGLFYHAPDVPFFWGRGNGWVAAGMAELLRSMPDNHKYFKRILGSYKKMMETLLKYQDKEGTWHQLIDKPELSWVETSCTGMFTYAMITGVKNGWLDETLYGPAARKGWLGLIKYIDGNSDIREVCEGTNKKNDLQYYLNRKRNVGDMHGQAPLLWCASALLR